MGLDDVTQEILQDAEEQADEIRREAEEKKESLLEDAREEAEQIRQEAEEAAEAEADALRKKELAAARMDARQAKLEAREDVLDDVFQRFREDVDDLGDDEERELVKAALDRLDDEIDIGTVHASDAVQDVADAYGSVEPLDRRGVVVESEDGTRRFDLTFDTVADKTVAENRRDVSEALFG